MITDNTIMMGDMPKSWKSKKMVKQITFGVTDDCNMRCTYCNFAHKSNKNKMTFDIAKKAVDYILSNEDFLIYDAVIWDFIGGEPTIEMELIDKICDYLLEQMYVLNHKWFYSYRIMIGTNGLLYSSEKFQNFFSKHGVNLSVSITVDGNREKHNLSRKKVDGSGSYDDIVKNLPLYFEQTGQRSTKATFAHADLPYLKESVISLWNLGFIYVMANVVFEDVWHEGDDKIFEDQLIELADYILENRLWNKYSVRFFSPYVGYPAPDSTMDVNFCGTGNMLAINHKGEFYPCMRFMDSALTKRKGRSIGNIEEGIDLNKTRAFSALSCLSQSNEECLVCDVASGCAWCTGHNYDSSTTDTIFERMTFHCKMHKANARACKYFWQKYEELTGNISPWRHNMLSNISSNNKYLYIIKNAKNTSICNYSCENGVDKNIDSDVLNKARTFCEAHNYIPVYVGFSERVGYGYYQSHYSDLRYKDEFTIDIIYANDMVDIHRETNISSNVIFKTNVSDISMLSEHICQLLEHPIKNISINIQDYNKWTKETLVIYKKELEKIAQLIINCWSQNRFVHIDRLTHSLLLKQSGQCMAGRNTYTMFPNGKIYLCPAFYYLKDNEDFCVGNIDSGIENKYKKNLENAKFGVCNTCKALHCQRCIFNNKISTGELSVSAEIQCVISHLELKTTDSIIDRVRELNIDVPKNIKLIPNNLNYFDPLSEKRGNSFPRHHFESSLNLT